MRRLIFNKFFLLAFFSAAILGSCKDHVRISEKEIVKKPAEIDDLAKDIIQETLEALVKGESIPEVAVIKNAAAVDAVYHDRSYAPVWTHNGKWKADSDALLSFIKRSRPYGLLPEQYYLKKIATIQQQLNSDTATKENKLNASLWAEADLLLTSAFVKIIKDVKVGRLIKDSSAVKNDFLSAQLDSFLQTKNMVPIVTALEPKHSEYQKLKQGLSAFLATARFKKYTYVNIKDSVHVQSLLRRRLSEEDSIDINLEGTDSVVLAKAIMHYQKIKGLKPIGKISAALIQELNQTDEKKFLCIALNMDRYKLLPSPMPPQYILVNIPGYYLRIIVNDSVAFRSKVVVGKPQTRTPVLSSAITNMVTYPKWTIPESIIKKDVLPALKKDPSYTLRKGFSVVDNKGNEINPYSVNWAKYQKTIPYKVVQGSGDDNALGVLKFNFSNKYSVYLHDTNQRYLFSRKERALSHGCVRIEDWQRLAYYLLRNDSLAGKSAVPADSVRVWLAKKEKHVIPFYNRVPLFIQYFTCEAKGDKLIFYDDIYGEDRRLQEKYFSN